MNTVSTLLHGNVAAPSTTLLVRRVFIRLLGPHLPGRISSAGWQLDGLVGEAGIRPAGERLAMLESAFGGVPQRTAQPALARPIQCHAQRPLDRAAAVLVCLGLLPMAMLGVCWVTYLSIVNGGDVFFNYQDVLLLEVGFLAIFWAPWHWRLNAPQAALGGDPILLLWLLARFMFFSGYVKLQSGDGTWTELTALDFLYHYWTQPLPVWTAWFMDPAAALVPEDLVRDHVRHRTGPAAAGVRAACHPNHRVHRSGRAATGHHRHRELRLLQSADLVLCVVLLDDAQLRCGPNAGDGTYRPTRPPESVGRRIINAVVAICILALSTAVTLSQFTRTWSRSDLTEPLRGYRLVNAYGLFRSMTTTRPELQIEGSRDGTTWQPYTFIYKPGPLDRMPPLLPAEHAPADRQMWFDGLYAERLADDPSMQQRMILPDLLRAFADQRGPVLDLFETTPFTDEGGPRFPSAGHWTSIGSARRREGRHRPLVDQHRIRLESPAGVTTSLKLGEPNTLSGHIKTHMIDSQRG